MNLLIRLRICCRDIKFAACGFICACRYDIGFSLSFFSTTFLFILAPCHVPKIVVLDTGCIHILVWCLVKIGEDKEKFCFYSDRFSIIS